MRTMYARDAYQLQTHKTLEKKRKKKEEEEEEERGYVCATDYIIEIMLAKDTGSACKAHANLILKDESEVNLYDWVNPNINPRI